MKLCPKCSNPMELVQKELKILIWECEVCDHEEEYHEM